MTTISPRTKTGLVRRELVQLAGDYVPGKHDVSGWCISEKLDGCRALWLGGIDRGLPTIDIPWAGIRHPKTGETKKKITPVSTGLWSRSGNPIAAPDWFLDLLPKGVCLDGELWAGRNKFQETMSIVKQEVPDERWQQIRYAVYSSPRVADVFGDGEIKNAQMWRNIDKHAVIQWACLRENGGTFQWVSTDFHWLSDLKLSDYTFADELAVLGDLLPDEKSGAAVFVHKQDILPLNNAAEAVERWLQPVLAKGGEGVILRDPQSTWRPKRHNGILKYKPEHDSEARVVGFTAGETGVTGNMLGKIGAIYVEWLNEGVGHTFKIGTGFSMEDREFATGWIGELDDQQIYDSTIAFARNNPGKDMRAVDDGEHIKRGDLISFKYRELTDDGKPKEARYFRQRVAE